MSDNNPLKEIAFSVIKNLLGVNETKDAPATPEILGATLDDLKLDALRKEKIRLE